MQLPTQPRIYLSVQPLFLPRAVLSLAILFLVPSPYLLVATCPLPGNNTCSQSHGLPLHGESKVLDESWQSRQGVEATVLTAITGIGADS